MERTKPIIELVNVSKTIKDKCILDKINLELFEGDIYSLIGANGAGKSSLMKVIVNLYRMSEGEKIQKENLKIGYLPEHIYLYRDVKVIDLLYYFAELAHLSKDEAREKIKKLSKIFDFSVSLPKKFEELSGGNIQKLGIIVTFLRDCDLYILDEPTTALDPVSREKLFDYLNEICKNNNAAVLISSHNLDEMIHFSKKVFVMREAKIVFKGEMNEQSYDSILNHIKGGTA